MALSINRIHHLFFPYFRTRRMRRFAAVFRPTRDTSILDVGGALYNWQTIGCDARVTLVNIGFRYFKVADRLPPNVSLALGDGRRLAYADDSFEICYSNSVIEHLSDFEGQQRFAAEVRRVGRGVWVQTPARWFFLEPHLVTPFIHWLPRSWQRRLLRNFTLWGLLRRPSQARVDEFLHEVRLLTYSEMKALFPDCRIERERFFGMTKAYVAVRRAATAAVSGAPNGLR
jgi:hypothetical protein